MLRSSTPGDRRPVLVDSQPDHPGLSELLTNMGPGSPVLRHPHELDSGRAVPLRGGARLSVGPGAQLRYRSGPNTTPVPVVTQARLQVGRLLHDFGKHGLQSVFQGMDPETRSDAIPLQLRHSRQRLLESYLSQVGAEGVDLMRLSCGMSLSLPFGDSDQLGVRFAAAEKLAPVLGAVFAASPLSGRRESGFVSRRMQLWSELAPVRSPFVGWNTDEDPVNTFLDYALDAPAIMAQLGDERIAALDRTPTFRHWLQDGHEQGHPTIDDWKLHLSTLYPFVGPQGGIVIRVIDSQIPNWFGAATLLWWSLIMWSDAREWADLDVRPSRLAERATRVGVRDPLINQLAHRAFDLAIAALEARPHGEVPSPYIEEIRRYRSRYLDRRRMPADDVLDRHGTRLAASEGARAEEMTP